MLKNPVSLDFPSYEGNPMTFTHQQALAESERCLYCFDAPCTQACPVHIDIPAFISMIKSSNVIGAAQVVKRSNALANVCGRVCPEEIFCQSVCNRARLDKPIHIRELHSFATQREAAGGFLKVRAAARIGKTVAVIGAGPAGLGCAFELSTLGYDVHVYDPKGFGGVPRNSIPLFRLSDKELRSDIEFLSPFFHSHQLYVDAGTFEFICKQHEAVFVGIGLGLDKLPGIPGEHLNGVVPVLEYLERAKKNGMRGTLGKRVVIIGGGNVSLDAATTAMQYGAMEATLLYRRSEREMKVWNAELQSARNHGVHMQFLTMPVEVVGNGHVTGLRCRRTRLSERMDASGRPVPVEVPGSDMLLEADTVVFAIGQRIRSEFAGKFRQTSQGYIHADENFQTSVTGVFAGGDVIAGEGTVVQSVAQGKQAARAMHKFITAKMRRSEK